MTTNSFGNLRHGVFQRFSGLKFERRLKVVLLSGTMGVLGSLAAYAGSSGLPLGANIGKIEPAGSVSAQTLIECLPWDAACLLLRPVGTVPGASPGQGGRNGGGDGGDAGEADGGTAGETDGGETDGGGHSRSGLDPGDLSNPGNAPGSQGGQVSQGQAKGSGSAGANASNQGLSKGQGLSGTDNPSENAPGRDGSSHTGSEK